MTSLFSGRKRRRRGGRLSDGLAGLAAGAGLMYFLDPRRGPGRRSQVAQRAERVLREAERTAEAGVRDLEHRARGLAHEARARLGHETAADEVIVERVRARLGRLTAHPGAIEVVSHDGHVRLQGPVFAAEHAQALRGVRLVRGVRGVEDRLEPHETAEGVPPLQGAGPRSGLRPEPFQRSWAPATKLVAAAAGALLAGRALFGKGFFRIPAGIAGAALLGRVMGESGPARREARRVARAAGDLAHRGAERVRERGGRRASRSGPEVQEAKSPAELEAGAEPARQGSSASPERGRERRRRGGRQGGEARSAAEGEGTSAAEEESSGGSPGFGDVAGAGREYLAPPAGAGVREADLGSTSPPQEQEPRREGQGEGEEEGPERRGRS